jgi:hypothetical protein
MVPEVHSVDVKCEIDRHDIKIHLFGNLLTDFGSMFEVFFKGPMAKGIENAIKGTLNNVVPTTTNNIIGKLDGVINWMPKVSEWMLDWQTAEPFLITDTWVSGGFQGLFYSKVLGKELPTDVVPVMPVKDSIHSEKYQNRISSFTINSFFSSMTEVMDP